LLEATVSLTSVNPEKVARSWRARRRRQADPTAAGDRPRLPHFEMGGQDPVPPVMCKRSAPGKYRAIFCGVMKPKYPGISGGEIRDFHLVRELVRCCDLSFVSLHRPAADDRSDPIRDALHSYSDPVTIAAGEAALVNPAIMANLQRPHMRLLDRLRRNSYPVVGPRLPRDVSINSKLLQAFVMNSLRRSLKETDPHFLFVSPQTNPLALLLSNVTGETRKILATYDVEKVRLDRLRDSMAGFRWFGAHLEARRAARFERQNVNQFEGIIAVSELDRSIFIGSYGVAPERVLAIENGVDTNYFGFRDRKCRSEHTVLYVGNLGYRPNHLAAMRLVLRIMPLVWRDHPTAEVWIVGADAQPELLALSDGKRVFVTGKVASVLPYLSSATVMCARYSVESFSSRPKPSRIL